MKKTFLGNRLFLPSNYYAS